MSGFTREAILARQAEMLASVSQTDRPVTARAARSTAAFPDPRAEQLYPPAALAARSTPDPAQVHDPESDTDEEFDGGVEAPPHVKGKRGIQMRNACVTYYPPFPGNFERYLPLPIEEIAKYQLRPVSDHILFYATALEVAPKTGLLHGHLYIEFKQSMTILQIQKILGTTECKVFVRKGTAKQATDYVFKRGDYESKQFTQITAFLQRRVPNLHPHDILHLVPYVWGVQKKQGQRSDLDRYVEMAMEGVMRCEFLAQERGAGLRYIKYFDSACSAVDGTDRNDQARNNKRIAYDRYVEACIERSEVPCRFYEFNHELDFKVTAESEKHRTAAMAAAFQQREEEDQEAWQGAMNKQFDEANLPEEDEQPEEPKKKSGKKSVSDSTSDDE